MDRVPDSTEPQRPSNDEQQAQDNHDWVSAFICPFPTARAQLITAQARADEPGWVQFSAFEALAQTSATMKQIDAKGTTADKDPETMVPVPRWIIEVLADSWNKYFDVAGHATLGEVFKIEGHGQGRKPKVQSFGSFRRDLRLALNVIHYRETETECNSIEDAIFMTAKLSGFSDVVVRKAYYRHRVSMRGFYYGS